MSTKKSFADFRSSKYKQYAVSYDEQSSSTPILKTRKKQTATIILDVNGSPIPKKDPPLPKLDFSPVESLVGSPQFKETIISVSDYGQLKYPNSTLYGQHHRGRHQDLTRTQQLQNKLLFKTYEESNCSPPQGFNGSIIQQTSPPTNYAFSPNFEVGMFSPSNMTSADSSTMELKSPHNNIYQKKINEIRKKVQAKLRDESKRNSIITDIFTAPPKKVNQVSPVDRNTTNPVIVLIQPHQNKVKTLNAVKPPQTQKKTRNGGGDFGKLAHSQLGFDYSKTSSFQDQDVVPQRVKHLLHRMQYQFKNYHYEEHAGLMERVFKARVMEEKAFPSIKKHNDTIQR